jgi:hypothetical protein
MKLAWTDWKAFVDEWGLRSKVRYTPKDQDGSYQHVWVSFEGIMIEVNAPITVADAEAMAQFESGYLQGS